MPLGLIEVSKIAFPNIFVSILIIPNKQVINKPYKPFRQKEINLTKKIQK